MDNNKAGISSCPGIYVVYRCDYDPFVDMIDVKEVIYIGETDDIYKRHNSSGPHEHYEDFKRYAGGKEHICYGEILLPDLSEDDRKIIEAAMIHIEKPEINTDYKDHYTKPASYVRMTGGPDCWERNVFIHPRDNGDETAIEGLVDYLRRNCR